MGSLPVPKAPTDLFTTEISDVIDDANQIIADQGLRPVRVFLRVDRYAGQAREKQGAIIETTVTELLPTPMVKYASTMQIAMSGGILQRGSATLHRISRKFTKEQLLGKTVDGADYPVHWDFSIALKGLGDIQAVHYHPASDPILLPTAWEMALRPINRSEGLPGIVADA